MWLVQWASTALLALSLPKYVLFRPSKLLLPRQQVLIAPPAQLVNGVVALVSAQSVATAKLAHSANKVLLMTDRSLSLLISAFVQQALIVEPVPKIQQPVLLASISPAKELK